MQKAFGAGFCSLETAADQKRAHGPEVLSFDFLVPRLFPLYTARDLRQRASEVAFEKILITRRHQGLGGVSHSRQHIRRTVLLDQFPTCFSEGGR